MTTLVIDNYDSFTLNLCHLVAQVTGRFPLLRRNDEIDLKGIRALAPDAIILSPGPGHPSVARDFGVCADLLNQNDIPVLGVCLGHQGIAHLAGALVALAARPVHGLTSRIRHRGAGLFRDIPQDFQAVRYHSFIVKPPLPPELEALAWTQEGEIMALRHRSMPFWGVQFHPESIATEHGARLLENFFTQISSEPESLTRTLDVPFDPEQIYIQYFSQDEQSFWLDSSAGGSYSFVGGSSVPGSQLISYETGGTLFKSLRPRLNPARHSSQNAGFCGGWVGYLGFEMKRDLGYSCRHTAPLPDAQFLFAPAVLRFDHADRSVQLALTNTSPELVAWADDLEIHLRSLRASPHTPVPLPKCKPRLAPEEYLSRIQLAQELITYGESYEVCLTDLMLGDPIPDPLSYYRQLRLHNPAPYSAFLRLHGATIACFSPERFLRIESDGTITSKPIKGTAPRSGDHAEDEQNKQALLKSTKDAAEHLMIVDLVRNDLGRVSEPCSVHVPVFRDIESYTRVHHLVSTVAGTLRSDCDALDAIAAAFPAGSMTGAPKARTLEILDLLEAGPRGVYSGAIGWIGINGTCDLNVVIRTAVVTEHSTEIGSGGAIVALSDAPQELAELRLKVSPLADLT